MRRRAGLVWRTRLPAYAWAMSDGWTIASSLAGAAAAIAAAWAGWSAARATKQTAAVVTIEQERRTEELADRAEAAEAASHALIIVGTEKTNASASGESYVVTLYNEGPSWARTVLRAPLKRGRECCALREPRRQRAAIHLGAAPASRVRLLTELRRSVPLRLPSRMDRWRRHPHGRSRPGATEPIGLDCAAGPETATRAAARWQCTTSPRVSADRRAALARLSGLLRDAIVPLSVC